MAKLVYMYFVDFEKALNSLLRSCCRSMECYQVDNMRRVCFFFSQTCSRFGSDSDEDALRKTPNCVTYRINQKLKILKSEVIKNISAAHYLVLKKIIIMLSCGKFWA